MINFSMWTQALTVIPRLSREEWDRLDVVSRWLIATRAAVFVMTALAAAIGGMIALRDGIFSWPRFIACLIGLVFAHATNNLLNDYIDYTKGIDRDNYYRTQYGPQTLECGFFTVRQLLTYAAVSGLIALACGIYLALHSGVMTLYLIAVGAFFVIFYTWPLKYIGMGEPSVLIVWGPLMVGGSYYVVSGGTWSWDAALVGLVYAAGPTTVLFGKHTDKLSQDREKGVHTLPVIIGERAARYATIGIWIAQFFLTFGLFFSGIIGPAVIVIVLSIDRLVWVGRVFAKPRPTEPPSDLPPNVWPLYLSAHAFVYNRRFGALFLIGLIIDTIARL